MKYEKEKKIYKCVIYDSEVDRNRYLSLLFDTERKIATIDNCVLTPLVQSLTA